MSAWRIGQGFDVHAFTIGDHVVLGGVKIAHTHGLRAHSDGDVLLHALCDALLGALALGDIGHHFPPDDPAWADADSRDLLRAVLAKVQERGFEVANLDGTLICERPKIGPHVAAMQHNIASDLGLEPDAVSVKATTTERLGFCGREEGIAAMVVAMLHRSGESKS